MKTAHLDIYTPWGNSAGCIVDLNDKPGHQAGYCLKSFAGHSGERESLIIKAKNWATNQGFNLIAKVTV